MVKKVTILIPMAGEGKRFADAGYKDPKPLIDVNGDPMIVQVIRNLRPKRHGYQFIFIYQDKIADIARPVIGNEEPSSIKISINGKTEGSACTALLATDEIDNDDALIIASCDQLADFDVDEFIDQLNDNNGCLLTFPSERPHCSFVKLGDDGKAVEVAEKKVISNHANVGIYGFNSGRLFVHFANYMIENKVTYNGEYYLAPVYNEIIKYGGDVVIYEIPAESTHLLGTPEELNAYLERTK